jgi:COMPASS component SWD3
MMFEESSNGAKEESTYKLVPKLTISDNTSEVFCIRFSPDGKFIAAGCGDGAIRVFNAQTGALSYNLQGGSSVALPTTAIRFRPVTPTTRTKNVFIAANATGAVQHWHMTSGKCLHSSEDEGNQVYALDYNLEGSKFVTAGKDTAVRVYDEATKTLIQTMKGGMGYSVKSTPGHSNRIFSAKMLDEDENIVVSGGWDNTVQIWDIRVGAAVRSIYGPHICGDALDVVGNTIVTGSWRPDKQLELWDFTTGEKISDVPWHVGANQPSCMLYAAQFSKEGQGRFVAAGGSGANEAKVFDRSKNNAVVGTVAGLTRGVFTVDFSPDGQKLAIAGGDSSIRILDLCAKE